MLSGESGGKKLSLQPEAPALLHHDTHAKDCVVVKLTYRAQVLPTDSPARW